jgi:hypothetical protein
MNIVLPHFPIYWVKLDINNQTAAMGCFVERKITRHFFVHSTQWLLHRTGDSEFDQIWIEKNDWLISEQYRQYGGIFWQKLIEAKPNVDEFINELTIKQNNEKLLSTDLSQYIYCQENLQLGYFIDLTAFNHINDYLAGLSKNTRQQLKRSIKLLNLYHYEFQVITQPNQINEILLQCQQWHIEKWQKTATPSGFTNPIFNQFHQQLCATEQTLNATALVATLTIEQELVGCLYCFLDKTNCNFYLSCIKPIANKKLKIGLNLHYLLIEWCITQATAQRYDFLAGNAQYKQSLASGSEHYIKLVIQKKRARFFIEKKLSIIKQKLRQIFNYKRP